MAKSPSPHPGDDDKKIADADWLMRDAAPAKPTSKSRPKPRPSAAAPGPKPVEEVHSYDVVGADYDDFTVNDPAPVPPAPIPAAAPTGARAKPKRVPETDEEFDDLESADSFDDEDDNADEAVEQVWSRGAEWGFHLVWVGIAALGVAMLTYKAIAALQFLLAFLILGAGGTLVLALCYPIFITLERPVRITPEQAARDFFTMVSHPIPFYPRMWLLLSTAGRSVPEYSSYGQFKSYWKKKLASLQGGTASPINPLRFRVEDFRTSDKSAGKTATMAKYTLRVFRGDPLEKKEVASFLVSTSLVKGPDRMWYLNSGALPQERKQTPPAERPNGWPE